MGRFINEDSYQGSISNPLSLNLYTYVLNNPLIYADPTGHYCVSADGNHAHGGDCESSSSVFLGDDDQFQGRPIIVNGKITGYLGSSGNIPVEVRGNYWDSFESDKMIFRDHVGWYTLETIYGNASEVPIWDDPLFYVADAGALLSKGFFMGLSRFAGKQAAKKTAGTIINEVPQLGENKISHILNPKHDWHKLVGDPSDWSQVAPIMSRVMTEGAEGTYKGVLMKTLDIGGETVVVTYNRLPDGTIKVGNGWVAK